MSEQRRRRANWINLSTPLGLLLARLGGAALSAGPQGLILAQGYRWRFPTGSAFTLGDVVITRYEFATLLERLPHLLEHEAVHSRQWAKCWGLPFLGLYVTATGWSWLRTGDRAAGNVFERQAGLAAGGYAQFDPPSRARIGSQV